MATRSGSENRRRKKLIPVRASDEELQRLTAAAKMLNTSLSGFLRQTALERIDREQSGQPIT